MEVVGSSLTGLFLFDNSSFLGAVCHCQFAFQQRDSFRSRERAGGRGGGRGRGRDHGYGREYSRDDTRSQAHPPRGREFDRRSGTGRGRELNKGGGGKHAFGSEKDDAKQAEDAANWGFQSGGGEWGAIEAVEMVTSGDNWNSVNEEAQQITPVSWDAGAGDDGVGGEKNEGADAKEDNQDLAPGWGVSNGTNQADDDAGEAKSPDDVQWKKEKSMTYEEYLAQLAEKKEKLGTALSSSKGVRKPNEGSKAFAQMSVLKKKIEADSDTSILGAVTMKEEHSKKTMVDSTLNAVRNNLNTQKFFHEHGGGANRYRDRDRRGRGGDSRREYSSRNEMGGFGNRGTQAPNMDDTVAFPTLGARTNFLGNAKPTLPLSCVAHETHIVCCTDVVALASPSAFSRGITVAEGSHTFFFLAFPQVLQNFLQ